MAKGSRFLNQVNGVLGLTSKDLMISMGVVFLSMPITSYLHLEIVSLVLGGLSLGVLIPLRSKHRPKLIRDSVAKLYYRWRFFVS